MGSFMKKFFVFAVFVLLASGCAQHASKNRGGTGTDTAVVTGLGSGDPPSSPSIPYVVAERGPHSRIWQRVTLRTNVAGDVFGTTNSFTELNTGMAHLVANEWVDSNDKITISPLGGQAINGQHNVMFLGNINTAGAIDLTTPDGKHLRSTILGLSYLDTATGRSVMIGELQDSRGQLLPSENEVLYPNAFTNVAADVLYKNTKAGLEQNIILRRQLPSPADGVSIPLRLGCRF